MKIVIVGTSNSVMGNKGYIQALRLDHDVVQLSTGRTPFYTVMNTIMVNKDEVENSDLLIIDHYINDINFYGDRLGNEYREHLELFYKYISSLNVNVLNLMFPIYDLENRSSLDIYHQTKSLCEQFNVSILDLNEVDIPFNYYQDKIHLKHDVSYALGLSMNQGLSHLFLGDVSSGEISDFPFYVLNAKDIASYDNEVGNFENSLVNVDYLKLVNSITIHNTDNHRLVALGLLRDKNVTGCSGFSLNGEYYALNGGGYFMETLDNIVKGDLTISPLNGHKEVRNMMGRGISKGEFTYCYISDFLFIDMNKSIEYTPSKREVYNIDIKNFLQLAERIGGERQYFPKISNKYVDRLRDLLLAMDFMKLANLGRPSGGFIKKKLAEYKKYLNEKSKEK